MLALITVFYPLRHLNSNVLYICIVDNDTFVLSPLPKCAGASSQPAFTRLKIMLKINKYSFMRNLFFSVLCFFVLTGYCTYDKNISDANKPEFLAHRGYSSLYPESTMIAFEKAIDAGVSGLELDIHQTIDRKIVVMHDPSVERTTDGKGDISKITSEYIRGLTIDKTEKVPFLENVLELAGKNSFLPVWIEIKHSAKYPDIATNLTDIIKKYNYENYVVVQSFKLSDLELMHNLNPNIKLLKLYTKSINYDVEKIPKYIDYIGLPLGAGIAQPALIKKYHEVGLKVIFWRENDVLENDRVICFLTNQGADGFMINKPVSFFRKK